MERRNRAYHKNQERRADTPSTTSYLDILLLLGVFEKETYRNSIGGSEVLLRRWPRLRFEPPRVLRVIMLIMVVGLFGLSESSRLG